jgi:hypothetical protein
MVSLDPATLGKDGYREIFQTGETLDGNPLIDRQHPHDFLMQAAVVWRTTLWRDVELTLAGAPVGEPALGPIAFMHRSSAAENPTAPLAHHTFDSTHITNGVLTAGLTRGPWEVEASLFHGREPDEDRWDLMDPGPLDSSSVRGWYRPNDRWTFQASHGFLNDPEILDPGDIRRTALSTHYVKLRNDGLSAVTIAYGRRNHPGRDYNAILGEATHIAGNNGAYFRWETLQVESDVLRFGAHLTGSARKDSHVPEGVEGVDIVSAATVGLTRRLFRWSGWDGAIGGDVTLYGIADVLQPTHGEHPVSFHLFFRIRPPAMMRMWDMTMTRGMH